MTLGVSDSAMKRKRDKKDLLEDSKSNASPGDSVHMPNSTDKIGREIPEARQLRFEDDEMPLKRLKVGEVIK